VQFGFSRSVFDYLKRNTPDIDLPKSQLQAFGDFEIFPDGTIVKFPSNEDFEKFIRCLNA